MPSSRGRGRTYKRQSTKLAVRHPGWERQNYHAFRLRRSILRRLGELHEGSPAIAGRPYAYFRLKTQDMCWTGVSEAYGPRRMRRNDAMRNLFLFVQDHIAKEIA